MNIKDTWNIETFIIEHITGIVPIKDANACQQMLAENGYKLTASGAYTDHQMFPRVDSTRWQFRAEKKIDRGDAY